MAPTKRKAKEHTSSLFVDKLKLLRNFTDGSFSESDLSACLRQCGLNVELAAEKLITGQFNIKPSSNNNKAAASLPKPAAAVSKNNNNNATNKRRRVTLSPEEKKDAKLPSTMGSHLWLCQRWVVGLNTTKNGRLRYNEKLQMTHSNSGPAMVRFKGSDIEGTLGPNVAALLTPLLREEKQLISMEAEALMDERGLAIGGEVPMAIR